MIGLTGLFFICLITFFASQKIAYTKPVYDIDTYENILKQLKEFAPDMVYHFPESIPEDVQNVDFYFRHGLHAKFEIQLRYKISPDKILEYYETYSQLKTKSCYGKTFVHFLDNKAGSEIIELSEDFEVLQLDKNPDRIIENNKGHGVKISKEKNEIIFWAEW